MPEFFAQLMGFFGISGAPDSFGTFVPWFFEVICAIGIFLFLFNLIKVVMANISRSGR